MTKAGSNGLPHRGVGKGKPSAIRYAAAGKNADLTGGTHTAVEPRGRLHGDDPWIEPPVTESLLREFLALLEAAQAELGQRWNDQEKAGRHADCA
ncbi:hypothetical protein J2X68_007992 [Streptomyces sp. 3330]|nr:hypothetical protein [Streptomyces sp. 3330]